MVLDPSAIFRVFVMAPKFHIGAFTLLIVTNHETPQEIVKRLMFKSVLRSGDAKRDMIQARKGPRITHPTRQKGYDRGRFLAVCGQGSPVTERDFHIRGW